MRSNMDWTRNSRVVLLIRFRRSAVTMSVMTEPRAVISRLSADFAAINDDVMLARRTVDLDGAEGKVIEAHMRLLRGCG